MLRTLLLAPLRLATGWGSYPRLLGWIGISMLVLMRLTLGWHFFSEGHEKYRQGDWDAKPFFAAARGPFAGHFQGMIWDWDGKIRLDIERTKQHFALFRERAKNHFGFDEQQQRQAQLNYSQSITQLEGLLEQYADEIEEFELERQRVELLNRKPLDGVPSLAGQRETIRSQWRDKIRPVFDEINTLWESYERAQNNLASLEQAMANGRLPMGVPRSGWIDTSVLNRIIPYFDMAIGVCLVLGLLTPLAALAGAGFLGSVFLSQYPPVTGLGSSYQLIEAMACLVLAGTAAGRFGGLDFFIHATIQKYWPR